MNKHEVVKKITLVFKIEKMRDGERRREIIGIEINMQVKKNTIKHNEKS